MKYKRKSNGQVVDAVQITERFLAGPHPEWIRDAFRAPPRSVGSLYLSWSPATIVFRTSFSAACYVDVGSYIINDEHGNIRYILGDSFSRMYEPVSDDEVDEASTEVGELKAELVATQERVDELTEKCDRLARTVNRTMGAAIRKQQRY